ncbi:MAG: flagellar M-ring protein FliF [Oscillospiraceae bacterium]|jgi:flagellar M-ring protein FliF|nr:flagellar M-ring protein FliF [Oscillospiraceae bacterium]
MEKIKETLGKIFGPLKEKWSGIAGKTRIVILAVAGVVVVSAIILTVILNRSGYTVLYRASSLAEANEVAAVLSGLGHADTRISSSNEILVPANTEGDLRWQLSLQGYPRSSNFNNDVWNTSVGMFSTETEKRMADKLQLQSWLMAQLGTIPEVESAMVILNIPDTPGYVLTENKKESSASVKLNLKTGKTLDAKQINGIYNIVRTAVPELKQENITIADGNGITLAYSDMNDSGDNLQLKQQMYAIEHGYTELVTESFKVNLDGLLKGIFSDYNLAVNVKIDYSDKVTEEKTYTPIVGLDGGIVRNIVEKYAAGGLLDEGATVGTFPNADIAAPDYPTVYQIAAGNDFYTDWNREINYEINQKIEQFTENGMRVVDVSAAVVVNSTALPPADVQLWTELIANSLGTIPANVSFAAMPFPPQASPGMGGPGAGGDSTRNLLIYIIICLGALLIVLFTLAIMTSGSKKKRQVSYRGAPPVISGASQGFTREELQPAAEPEGFELPSLLEESETKDVVLKREIREFSRSNPEIVAQLIRTWLRSDE